jgi:hypothetical protein
MDIESDYGLSLTHDTNSGNSVNCSLSDTNSFVSTNSSDFSLVSGASSTNDDIHGEIVCSRSQESGVHTVDDDCESNSQRVVYNFGSAKFGRPFTKHNAKLKYIKKFLIDN